VNEDAFLSILAVREELALLCRVKVGTILIRLSAVGEVLALCLLLFLIGWALGLLLLRLESDVVAMGGQVNDGLPIGPPLHLDLGLDALLGLRMLLRSRRQLLLLLLLLLHGGFGLCVHLLDPLRDV
jgi:hypothetical protein